MKSAAERPPSDRHDLAAAKAALESGSGAGVKIAVIDSGVEADHPRLAKMNLADSVSFEEKAGRIIAIDDDPGDAYGHGTAVAGIIHELAPEAEIGSFRVIDSRSLSKTHLICAGVAAAIERGYDILNCSFGCRGLAKFILPHKEWADQAWLRDIHVVAACSNHDADEAEWPSHFSSVIGVDLADTPGDEFYYRRGRLVSFSARGENVEVAWRNGTTLKQTGTSFAAPRITGLMARLVSVFPHLSAPSMLDLMANCAESWHPGISSDW
ncbi:MAG: S8 family serine peptidase [Verrucomicrobiota bacterium]